MSGNWNGKHWIRDEKRLALHIRDGFQCCYCGCDLRNAEPGAVTLDHLVPRCAGGTNDAGNLITACKPCNSSRGAKPWMDFATGGAVERIQTRRCQPVNLPLAKALISGEIADLAWEVEAER